jgi:hypothetical protein
VILKVCDPLPPTADRFILAGRRAEEQMAHYLERAYGTRDDIFVFHDLRLEKGDDAAQIDHLILNRHGIILIESKSVTGTVRVNEHGEWTRVYGSNAQGMPSPVLQGERQARFLGLYLEAHAELLLGKLLGLVQCHFGYMPIEVLVAISDQGIIQRGRGVKLPAVFKADQITGEASAIMERWRKAGSLLNLNFKTGYTLGRDEVERIAAFFPMQHRPRHPQPTPQPAPEPLVAVPAALPLPEREKLPEPEPVQVPRPIAPISTPAPTPKAVVPAEAVNATIAPALRATCRHCKSQQVNVVYGRYGYYLKCDGCDGNTNIQTNCASCGDKERIRKDRNHFFAECGCGSSRFYHKNTK